MGYIPRRLHHVIGGDLHTIRAYRTPECWDAHVEVCTGCIPGLTRVTQSLAAVASQECKTRERNRSIMYAVLWIDEGL